MTTVKVKTATGWQNLNVLGPSGPPPDTTKAERRYGVSGESGSFGLGIQEPNKGVAGDMRFSIVPTVNCWWLVEYQLLVRTLDAAWYTIDGYVTLDQGVQTSDELGRTTGGNTRTISHNTFGYTTMLIRALWKLQAGKSYTARALINPNQGTWVYHKSVDYMQGNHAVLAYWGMPELPGAPPLVTSLPASPRDGQEVYYLADATNGINWHLRYRAGSASAYKWEFVGGQPLHAETVTNETVASTGGWVDLPSGPNVVIPLAGDYLCRGRAVVTNTTSASRNIFGVAGAGGTPASYGEAGIAASGVGVTVAFETLFAGTVLPTTLRLRYNCTTAVGTWYNRTLTVTPRRVG